DRRRDRFLAARSIQGALLGGDRQRRRRGADHGGDDADGGAARHHGNLRHSSPLASTRVVRDRVDGGGGRLHARVADALIRLTRTTLLLWGRLLQEDRPRAAPVRLLIAIRYQGRKRIDGGSHEQIPDRAGS